MYTIAGLFASIFPVLFGWIASFITRKLVVLGITVSTFLLLTGAFLICIRYMIETVLGLAIMPSWISLAVGMFMPFNFVFVLSNILSAEACRWAYDKAIEKVQLINSAV